MANSREIEEEHDGDISLYQAKDMIRSGMHLFSLFVDDQIDVEVAGSRYGLPYGFKGSVKGRGLSHLAKNMVCSLE
jgi:hypothetical protein